jgi:hypothetical protein
MFMNALIYFSGSHSPIAPSFFKTLPIAINRSNTTKPQQDCHQMEKDRVHALNAIHPYLDGYAPVLSQLSASELVVSGHPVSCHGAQD